jgi:hypothetical protein
MRAATACRAEQVAVGVGDQSAARSQAISAVGQRTEADQRRQVGSLRLARRCDNYCQAHAG